MEQTRRAGVATMLSLVLIMATLGACAAPAGPTAPGASTAAGGTTDTAPRPNRQLVMAATRDVSSLAIKLSSPGAAEIDFSFISNSPLALLDPQGTFRPLLAEELPSRDRGTWTVNADGTMATTWKIRPNAMWHDGRPVTARDFAFALRVYLDPAIEVEDRSPETLINRLEVVDEKTFVLHWKQIFPGADQLNFKRLPALPEHILGPMFAGDKQQFQNDSFWSSAAYIGNGPYRLVEWEKGVHHKYRAFDQYFLGRPKIDEVVIRIIPDENTVLANVLGGEIDITGAAALNPNGAVIAQRESGNQGRLVRTMGSLRAVRFQHDPAVTKQPALLDVRVRRAIVHGLDRAAIADMISEGTSLVADTPVAPGHPLYERVQQAIPRHPYDVARSYALLADAGWTKRGDVLVNRAGEQLALSITGSRSVTNDTEKDTIAGYLGALGMHLTVSSYNLRNTDREEIVKFAGLRTGTALAEDIPNDLRIYTSEECPTAERRYVGENGGCWTNPDFDRLYRVATLDLDPQQRADATVQALRIMTEAVGIMGMSHLVQHNWIRQELQGPTGLAGGQKGGYTWNIHEWSWVA